jgi:hypothetical protein
MTINSVAKTHEAPTGVSAAGRHRRAKRKPSGPWGRKVDDLIRAMGWPQRDWVRHFGASVQTVRRVRYGARPKLTFVRRLRQLERDYESELQCLAQGLITTQGRVRYSWVELPEPARPADRFTG